MSTNETFVDCIARVLMLGYWLSGLLILVIGIYDAVTFAYEKNHFGFKHPILIRYLAPAFFVVTGIAMIVAGFLV